MASRTLAMAEIIIEFFVGFNVDRILKLEPKNTKKAIWLLIYFRLIRIEHEKVVLTSEGQRYKKLPFPNMES